MPDVVELIGHAASGLIVVSLMMSSLLRLRLVNLTGSVVFALYAVLIGSLPVLLTNLAITLINTAHLRRMWRDSAHDAYFEVVDGVGNDVTHAHRDFTPGSVLSGTSGVFERRGIDRVTTSGATLAHERYLERMGFHRADGVWVRELR